MSRRHDGERREIGEHQCEDLLDEAPGASSVPSLRLSCLAPNGPSGSPRPPRLKRLHGGFLLACALRPGNRQVALCVKATVVHRRGGGGVTERYNLQCDLLMSPFLHFTFNFSLRLGNQHCAIGQRSNFLGKYSKSAHLDFHGQQCLGSQNLQVCSSASMFTAEYVCMYVSAAENIHVNMGHASPQRLHSAVMGQDSKLGSRWNY